MNIPFSHFFLSWNRCGLQTGRWIKSFASFDLVLGAVCWVDNPSSYDKHMSNMGHGDL